MKKIILSLAIAFSTLIYANPGDTTWVQANNVNLDYYNNFDTAVAFPNGSVSYRKILMYFTLGEYTCPSGATYCHQWDYTVTNYIMTRTGDTAELSRLITPFANTGVPRFPSNWQQHYVYDVTDFYNLLKDSATIRIFYSGYSGGFTANIKFAFIEGTPTRNVLGYDPLWLGSYSYGNTADPINSHLPTKQLTAPANTASAEMKFTVTGHGSDNNTQCCEFSSHDYSVLLNNSITDTKTIWRGDCGYNELYAQGGTWIYERGNWCPGSAVNTFTHPLQGVTANSTYSLGVNFAPYTSTGNYGNYALEGHVFYYGSFNHALDASLEDIIAPTNDENYFRQNPSNNYPVVKVKNNGSSIINSITFSYNVQDSSALQYIWNGTLMPLQDTIITLDALNSLTNLSVNGAAGTYYFNAQITSVNGSPDEDATNNNFTSSFSVAPVWPTQFIINMKTNSAGLNWVGDGDASETTWQITDMQGNIVASRLDDSTNTNYNDTVTLAPNQFYKFTINDVSCDGLHWWVWDANPSYGITAGYLFVKKLSGINIPMNGYVYTGTYRNDFGCWFSQNFTVKDMTTGIEPVSTETTITMRAYPNPAQDNVTVALNGVSKTNGTFDVIDAQGRTVLSQKANGFDNNIKLNELSNGVYTISYKDQASQLHARLIIVK